MYGYRDFEIDITGKTKEDIAKDLINRLTMYRIEHHKPSISFFAGDSGEGKSMTMLRWAEETGETDKDPEQFLQRQVIYTPFEYPSKFKWLLFDNEAKKLHELLFMEARELVKAKLWYSTINQSISDANALSRTIKPISLQVGSQDITDVDKPLRKTLTFYGFCLRPLQDKTRFYCYRVWKSRYNIDNPKLTLRKLVGTFVNGEKREKVQIQKLIINMPRRELKERFEEIDLAAKTNIIMKKLDMLQTALNKEKPQATRLEQIVELMVRDPGVLSMFIRRNQRSGSIEINDKFRTVYQLSKDDTKHFRELLEERLKQVGVIAPELPDKEE